MSSKKKNNTFPIIIGVLIVICIAVALSFSVSEKDKNVAALYEKAMAGDGIKYRSERFITLSDGDIFPVYSKKKEKYYFKLKDGSKETDITDAEYEDARGATVYTVSGKRHWYAAVKYDGKWGYLLFNEVEDKKGNKELKHQWLVKPVYEDAQPFCNGLAAVKENGKYGFIGIDGKVVVSPEYESVKYYSDDLIPVLTDGKWDYINMYGKQMIKGGFTEAEAFENGYAAVKTDNGWGYIDKEGKFVEKPRYDDAWQADADGFAHVLKDGNWSKISLTD